MDNDDSYSLQKFDAFICYRESDEGKVFAEITERVLFKESHLNSFVAHEIRNTYSYNFDKLREKAIEDCSFFVFINSEGAFDSTEVKKELRMAEPQLKSNRLKLIVLRHRSPQVKYRNEQFELETGVDLGGENQASFSNEADLLDVIPDVINNEKYSPYLNKTRAIRLEDYLKSCIAAVDKKDILDKKSLNEIFVWNKTILISTDHWNTNEQEIPSSESEDWNIDKFLKSTERYVLVGSPFGIGKTSYSHMLVASMAEKYLTEFNSFIPIYVPLRDHFNNIDDNGNAFQTILSLVPNNQSKILFIFDGIDEYGEEEEISSLYNNTIKPYLNDYPNSKFLLTTRLKAGLPRHFYADKYVRLLSFSPEKVDEFMSKYGINLRVSTIVQAGLSSDESGKALFCRMIAIIYDRKKTLQFGNDTKLNRTLLYHEFIHNIILGKDRHFSKNYNYEQHYLSEKRVLRKIAELKYIYGDSLTVKGVSDSIVNIDPGLREHFSELFDRLISAYFYIKDTHSYEKRIDFIHRSFIEYLVAEFYLESCLKDQISNVNMSNLSLETISFLEGLLYIIKSDSNDTDSYFDQILKSFGLNTTKAELRISLIRQGEKYFESEFLALPETTYYPQTKEIVFYKNLQNHRWISILLLNKLADNYKINSEKFFKFVRDTNKSILGFIVTIENLDLSYSRIEEGLGDYNLSGAKLSHSSFYGNFFGTLLSGADLSNSFIKVGTSFIGVDFSGSNLSNLIAQYDRSTSPFVAHFIDCNFDDCNMTNGVFEMTSFTLSKFNKTNLSGVKLRNYADISLTNFTEVTLDEHTDTQGINLLSKGAYFEWDNVRGNKSLIKSILDDFDPNNLDPKLKEKILHDNPDYQ